MRGVLTVSALATRMTPLTIPIALDALKDSAERLRSALLENSTGIPFEPDLGEPLSN